MGESSLKHIHRTKEESEENVWLQSSFGFSISGSVDQLAGTIEYLVV
jgi:hypothetical protein